MPDKIKRYLKSSYSTKKKQLPEDLRFLGRVPFLAITEYTKGKKTEFSIEFQPKYIESILTKANEFSKLSFDIILLKNKIECLEEELNEKQILLDQLKSKYKFAKKKVDKEIDPQGRSPKNYINVMEEKGCLLRGLPIPGGHPSLGKKK
jgi:hypothetical protein